jgi:small-conductance mechanosensitive channel
LKDLSVDEIVNRPQELIANLGPRIVSIAITLVIIWLLTRLVRFILNKLAERYATRRILIKNFIPIITLGINISTLLIIMFGILGIKSENLIALGISAGVAIGFAVQDLLANVFGGLFIIFTRPFTIGDKVELAGHYGEVVDINLMKIKIVTPGDSIINIPASEIIKATVSNANSGALDCQVITIINLPANCNLQKIKKVAREAVYSTPYVFLDKPVTILFRSIYTQIPLIEMKIKAYVYDHRHEFRFSSDIYERIQKHMVDNDILPEEFYSFPFKMETSRKLK